MVEKEDYGLDGKQQVLAQFNLLFNTPIRIKFHMH